MIRPIVGYIIYFKSRANYKDTSTWAKEALYDEFSMDEIRQVCKIVGLDGFGLTNANGTKIVHLEWLK